MNGKEKFRWVVLGGQLLLVDLLETLGRAISSSLAGRARGTHHSGSRKYDNVDIQAGFRHI